MVPPPFPLLLIVPAFFMDVLMHRMGRGRDWISLALLIAVAFVASFALVQWFFADFIVFSPAARNIFFAADRWDYNIPPGERHWRVQILAASTCSAPTG